MNPHHSLSTISGPFFAHAQIPRCKTTTKQIRLFANKRRRRRRRVFAGLARAGARSGEHGGRALQTLLRDALGDDAFRPQGTCFHRQAEALFNPLCSRSLSLFCSMLCFFFSVFVCSIMLNLSFFCLISVLLPLFFKFWVSLFPLPGFPSRPVPQDEVPQLGAHFYLFFLGGKVPLLK